MLYLPDFDCDVTLSRWTGRPHGLTIDPLGVECFVAAPEPRRRLFARRPAEPPAPAAYLHVLVHQELASDRIRSWAANQVALLGVLQAQPEATGDVLHRLTAEEAARLEGRDWTPTVLTLDGAELAASAFVAEPERWAAYVEIGEDRVALVCRGLLPALARLRTAPADEARRLRTEALRV